MRKILLIDDDEISNFLNQSMLKKSGLFDEIQVLNNALTALEVLKDLARSKGVIPEIILLDLMMPIMDGFEFLRELDKLELEELKPIKVIMLTSSLDPKDRLLALNNSRVIGFLSKPINQIKITDMLKPKE